MPRVDLKINDHKIISAFPGLYINIEELNNYLIKIMIRTLSCKEVKLQKDFFIIAPQNIYLPNTLKSLIDIEIFVTAYEERIKKQYKISETIERYLQNNVQKILFNKSDKPMIINERIFKADLSFLSDMSFNKGKINTGTVILNPRRKK